MNSHSGSAAPHPQFVAIPDPRSAEGVRAYREPAVARPLQTTFLEAERECAWTQEMRGLLEKGRAAEADARLAAELAGYDGHIAELCKRTSVDDIRLEGWDDLLPILAEWEGPRITAITLGVANPPDLVFESGRSHEPELLLGLYSDEVFPFGEVSNADLLAECAKDMPAWTDAEEDVEFYCTMSGLAELNGALINCKHRRFLRDGRDGVEGRAPGGYVEFVLGSWLLATRFLQAVERGVAEHALPAGCRLLTGTVGVNADFVTILGGEALVTKRPRKASSTEPEFASLTMKPWVPREDRTVETATSRPMLRQRLAAHEAGTSMEPRRGFLSGLRRLLRRPSSK